MVYVYEDVQLVPFKRYILCDCGGQLIYSRNIICAGTLHGPDLYGHQCTKCKETFAIEQVSPTFITKELSDVI